MAITVVLEIPDAGLIRFCIAQARGRRTEDVIIELLTKGAVISGYSPK